MYPPKRGGGVSSHAYDLSQALAESGHYVVVLTLGEPGIPSTNLTVYGSKNLAQMLLFCLLIAFKEKTDVIHCHSPHTMVFGCLFKVFRKPLVLTLHGESSIWQKSIHKWGHHDVRFLLVKFFEKIMINIADYVITVDTRLKSFAQKSRSSNISAILNCVDTSVFSGKAKSQKDFGEKIILCPRMLFPKNGVRYAIMALEHISKEIPDVKMLIAGDGPLRNELETLAKRISTENICFLGHVNYFDMPDLYRRSDVVILPSITIEGLQEASSIAALEAMACGTPVVASKIGGLKEIIVDKKTGFLVQEKDPKDLAEKTIFLLRNHDSRRFMGENSRKHILNFFSRKKWIKKIIKVYEYVTNEKYRWKN